MLPFPLTIRFADGKPARAGNVGYRSVTPRGSTFGPFGPSVSPLERLGTGQRWVPVGHASGLDLRALRALGLAPRRFGDGATFGTGWGRSFRWLALVETTAITLSTPYLLMLPSWKSLKIKPQPLSLSL